MENKHLSIDSSLRQTLEVAAKEIASFLFYGAACLALLAAVAAAAIAATTFITITALTYIINHPEQFTWLQWP